VTDTPDFLWCDVCRCFHNDPHGEGPFVCGDSPEECAEQYREELAKAPEPEFSSDWNTAGLNGLLGAWTEPTEGWAETATAEGWIQRRAGDLRMFTEGGVNLNRKYVHLYISGFTTPPSTLTVGHVTPRQRRLCQRTGHPHRVIASWWEGAGDLGATRWYRRITVCSRCGAELERDYNATEVV